MLILLTAHWPLSMVTDKSVLHQILHGNLSQHKGAWVTLMSEKNRRTLSKPLIDTQVFS